MARDCSRTSIGCAPLSDLGTGTYQGHQGGLYPNGSNYRPLAHETIGRHRAGEVVPRLADGTPDAAGIVGLVMLGHSTAHKVADQLGPMVDLTPKKWDKLVPVNACVAGRNSDDLDAITKPYWTTEVPAALSAAGVTKEQVQVAWMCGGINPMPVAWPDSIDYLKAILVDVAQTTLAFFQNLKQLYVCLPAYHGYKGVPYAEPMLYEQHFAVKALIEAQINDDPALNCCRPSTPIVAPWLSWGGDLWCDGMNPRASDGLTCHCPTDVDNQGVHPVPAYAAVLADIVLDQFKADACCHPWFYGEPLPGAGGTPTPPGDTGSLGG